ncbi:PRTRC genetic system protein A [Sphingomonas zeicaulis]|uniref:PRTRC system protein A n=1 Tax=Sphingomonas zeicaulis TaxID=1632740 RepID=UPI003D198412
MTVIADDATAAAILAAVPCYPVPPIGASPAIDALRDAQSGQGLAIGKDGVMLILRRHWLALDVAITRAPTAYLPYGSIGAPRADLRCGLIPASLRARIVDHFVAALPNEAAAFILWNETSGEFAIEYPEIDEATPSRLVYRPPAPAPGWHIVCDVHSHGIGNPFFSATDDADDLHAAKLALVFGQLDHPAGPATARRLCAGGMFLPLPRSPFAGDHHHA